MNSKLEQELLQKIDHGNESALEILFEKYYYRLCNFTFQYVRSFDLTEEVVSDVFLKLWKQRGNLHTIQYFKAYLYKAARNQSLNYLKKQKGPFQALDETEDGALSSLAYNPEEKLLFKELKGQLNYLVDMLPPRRRLIFKLSRMEGFSYKEIADILSISIHTVQNQMVQAVKQLSKEAFVDK